MRTMNVILAAMLGSGCLAAGEQAAPPPEAVYPGAEWERRKPEELKLDADVLREMDALMKNERMNGVLICRGYLVAEWNYGGKAQDKFETQSVTKSITSAVLGLALKDKLIPNLDAKVKKHYPAFDAGPYTAEITFRHLVTATSGIRVTTTTERYFDPGDSKPGLECRYHNDHTRYLGLALSHLYGKSITQVVQERFLKPLQAQDGIEWDGTGYGFSHWSARDLARMGYLYLHDGRWKDEQILTADFARESRKADPTPFKEWRRDPPPDRDLSKYKYGLAWCGAHSDKGTIWHMCGNLGQFCAVMPERSLVMVKLGNGSTHPCEGPWERLLWKLSR
jgi:CubicO group peptidase (beta-lactamase class C family)